MSFGGFGINSSRAPGKTSATPAIGSTPPPPNAPTAPNAPGSFRTVGGFGASTPAPPSGGFGAKTGPAGGFGASAPASGGFGTAAPASGGFGASAPASGGFGAKTGPAGGFGASAPATGGFGASAPASGGFGTAAPASGGFGASAPASGGFGASAPASGGFGASAPASGGFGAKTAPAGGFGASAPASGGFGTAAPASGGFGASAPATGGFGTAAPATGGFGAKTGTAGGFGASAPASGGFGASAPASGGFGAASAAGIPGAVPITGMGGPYTVASTPEMEQAEHIAKQSPMASYLIELDHAYDALHEQCRFRTFMYNICGPGLRDAAVHRERYIACMNGGGCSDEQWMRALQENPDPIHMYPVPLHFAQEIEQRVEKQKEAIDIMIKRVEDLLQDVEAVVLLDATNQTVYKELQQGRVMLQRRWYSLLVKAETMGRQGSKSTDGLVANRVAVLRQQLDAPDGFQSTLEELQPYLEAQTSRSALVTQGKGNGALPLLHSDTDLSQIRKWLQFMGQMQEGVESLTNFLDTNLNNMAAVRERVAS